ncbi:MAG TPA: glycosyltransferase family 4 protein [Rhizomicrobium sp.]|jgi:glycosyltransferase involved in cell wall biosynthesis
MSNSPIRILTITTLYPNSQQPAHGIFVENRLRWLTKDGRVKASVIAPVPWAPAFIRKPEFAKLRAVPREESRNGFTVHHPRYLVLPKVGMNLTPYTLYRALYREFRKLHQAGERFDLIDAHYFYPDGVAAAMLGRTFGIPVVITARGTDINLIPQFRRPRQLILKAARDAGALITVCQALKDELAGLGVPDAKITALRNGVDLEQFKPLDRASLRQKWQVSGFVLASVGLLIERKGHHLAIEALAGIPDATLLIAGAGPDREKLEALARTLGVGQRVRFLGALDTKSLTEIYNCADALVLASSREGWANVLLESMACGTPVIATAVWGTPEVVAAPEAGLLTERDTASIADAMGRLKSHPPERQATRRYAEKFDWQPTTEGQIAIFRSLLARGTP